MMINKYTSTIAMNANDVDIELLVDFCNTPRIITEIPLLCTSAEFWKVKTLALPLPGYRLEFAASKSNNNIT